MLISIYIYDIRIHMLLYGIQYIYICYIWVCNRETPSPWLGRQVYLRVPFSMHSHMYILCVYKNIMYYNVLFVPLASGFGDHTKLQGFAAVQTLVEGVWGWLVHNQCWIRVFVAVSVAVAD